jgi:hypothetical protein
MIGWRVGCAGSAKREPDGAKQRGPPAFAEGFGGQVGPGHARKPRFLSRVILRDYAPLSGAGSSAARLTGTVSGGAVPRGLFQRELRIINLSASWIITGGQEVYLRATA